VQHVHEPRLLEVPRRHRAPATPTQPARYAASPLAFLRRHTLLVDSVIALALLGISVGWLSHQSNDAHPAVVEYGLAVALCAPLALRRRHPTGVFAFIAAVAFVQWLADIPPRPEDLAILVASYTVAAYARRAEAVAATVVVLGGVVLAVARWRVERFAPALIAPCALAVAALVLGDDLRNRRAYLAALEERARRLEHEQEQQTQAAVAAERASIARELHDVVAHNLSVMVVQAEAATVSIGEHPDQARTAMAAVGTTGRQALAEMRRLLGVMRPTGPDGATSLAPQPGMAQLQSLVDGVRQAGLPVHLDVLGHPSGLPTGMELAMYRIVQEALTNTLKHAGPGATSTVQIRYSSDCVEVDVTDDGRALDPLTRPDPTGQGLVGMRERAAMYGGTVDAAPGSDGGFAVIARFPIGARG
jgi:signal transduction histidine kinase